MTADYNDGRWHGWNGGECPVHPESEIDYVSTHNGIMPGKARRVNWAHDAMGMFYPVIAFRVVTPYVEKPKPREVLE